MTGAATQYQEGLPPAPGVVALVVELHTRGGVLLAKVGDLLRTRLGQQVTAGGSSICCGTRRAAGLCQRSLRSAEK